MRRWGHDTAEILHKPHTHTQHNTHTQTLTHTHSCNKIKFPITVNLFWNVWDSDYQHVYDAKSTDYFLKREKTQKKRNEKKKKYELKKKIKWNSKIQNLNGNCNCMNEMSMSSERVGVYLESKCIDLKKQHTNYNYNYSNKNTHPEREATRKVRVFVNHSIFLLYVTIFFFCILSTHTVKKNKWRWTKIKKNLRKNQKKKVKLFIHILWDLAEIYAKSIQVW